MIEYIQEYLKYLKSERNYSVNTISSYEDDLKQFYQFLLKTDKFLSVDISAIDKNTIRSFLGSLLEGGLAKRSVARKLSSLRSFFKYLLRKKVIQQNPTLKILSPKLSRILPFVLDESSINELMNLPDKSRVAGLRDRAILELFYSTGIRLSELISLQIKDIDFYNDTIKVVGKGNKQRVVPFGKKAKEAMKEYLNSRDKLASGCKKKGFLSTFFLTNRGYKLNPKEVYRIVNKYISQVSEIKKKSPHVLRHTFATHMLDRGADLKAVKELLGHESLSTTQLYSHVTIDKLKRIYQQAHPKG